jgi:hypothetical protein
MAWLKIVQMHFGSCDTEDLHWSSCPQKHSKKNREFKTTDLLVEEVANEK